MLLIAAALTVRAHRLVHCKILTNDFIPHTRNFTVETLADYFLPTRQLQSSAQFVGTTET